MAIVGIRYEGGSEKDNLGYKSIYMSLKDGEKILFDSGDFVKDWYACNKYIILDLDRNEDPSIANSSTVDHFIMDGAKFDSAYLGFDKDDNPYLYYEYDGEGIEYFVPEGTTPTWNELKEMVFDISKDNNS